MMSQQAARCLMKWTPERSGIIRARFYSKIKEADIDTRILPDKQRKYGEQRLFLRATTSTVQKWNRKRLGKQEPQFSHVSWPFFRQNLMEIFPISCQLAPEQKS